MRACGRFWPGLGRLTRLTVSELVMTAEIVMMMAAMPRVALGLRRMAANEPSRISPSPSGRSGITPGFGAESPYRGPGPGGGGP